MHIQRLTLETQNIKTMNGFYSQILELPAKLENAALEIQIGSSQLVFLENPDSNAKYHIAFNIPEQQIETALTWLEARVPNGVADDETQRCKSERTCPKWRFSRRVSNSLEKHLAFQKRSRTPKSRKGSSE